MTDRTTAFLLGVALVGLTGALAIPDPPKTAWDGRAAREVGFGYSDMPDGLSCPPRDPGSNSAAIKRSLAEAQLCRAVDEGDLSRDEAARIIKGWRP